MSIVQRANARQVMLKRRNSCNLSGLAFVNCGYLSVDINSRLKNSASVKNIVNKMARVTEPFTLNSTVLENLRHSSSVLKTKNNWLTSACSTTSTNNKVFGKKDLRVDFKWPCHFSILPNFHEQSIFGDLGMPIAGIVRAFSFVDLSKFSSENAVACYYSTLM